MKQAIRFVESLSDLVIAIVLTIIGAFSSVMGILLAIALVWFFLLTPSKAEAGWLELQVHGASYHIDREKQRNEVNYGLGLKYIRDDCSHVSIGMYKNSQYKTSVYAAFGRLIPISRNISIGYEAGIINNYSFNDNKFGPMVVPVIGYRELRLRLTPFAKGTLGFSLELPLSSPY